MLFAVRRIVVLKALGSHISWVIVGALELVYSYVWAACTPHFEEMPFLQSFRNEQGM
jgi:hypothetical protein